MGSRLPLGRTLALLLCAAPGLAQVEILQLHGQAAGDGFGWCVAFVGDVDGDGFSDLAIGAPFHDAAGPDAGRVQVVSGRTSQVVRTWDGLAGQPHFGQSICGVGDLDGDGLADVLVGAATWWGDPFGSYSLPPGYAQLISGGSGAVLHTFTGSPGGLNFGYAVAGGRDLDGDGTPDLLVGEPGGADDQGYVYVYSGATFAKIRRDGRTSVRNFGHAICFLGDVDGDGAEDYAVGGPRVENSGGVGFEGRVFAIDGAGGTDLWTKSFGPAYSQLGWSVADVGDVDDDGVHDLLVGDRNAGGGWIVFPGKAYIVLYSGRSGAKIREHPRLAYGGGYGTSVTGLGDLDGDGRGEYVGGEPGWDLAGYWPLRVFEGAGGSKVAQVETPAGPGSSGNPATWIGWGFSLASGDASGDGLADLVVGAPGDDTAGTDAGLVSVQTIVRKAQSYCEAQVNSQGCTPTIFSTGTPSVTANSFRVKASAVLNNKSGLLFWGVAPKQTPFSGGFKCVAPPTVRTPLQNSSGNPPPDDCSGLFSFHWNAAYLASVGLGPGAQVFCQYWSRDAQSASTTNLTDALAFHLEP